MSSLHVSLSRCSRCSLSLSSRSRIPDQHLSLLCLALVATSVHRVSSGVDWRRSAQAVIARAGTGERKREEGRGRKQGMNVCLVCARVCDGWKAETKGVKNRILSLTPLASPHKQTQASHCSQELEWKGFILREERICAAAATSDRRPAPHTLRWTSSRVS